MLKNNNMQNTGPTPIIIIQQQAPPKPNATSYATTTSLVTGVMQVVAGVLSIVFQSIALAEYQYAIKLCSGIWCAVFFLISGSLGIAAGKTKNKCLIVGHMVMCIIAAIFALIMLIIASFEAAISFRPRYMYSYSSYPNFQYTNQYRSVSKAEFAMYIMLIILALFEGVVAIIGSAISCRGVCCNGSSVYPGAIQYIPQPGTAAAAPMVYNPNTGFIVPPGNHVAGTTLVEQPPPPYYYGQGEPQDSLAGVHKQQYKY